MRDLRVRRPADKDELIAKLAGDEPGTIFSSMKDLFIFAAALAASEDRKTAFVSTSDDPIRLELFKRDTTHELLINVLAVLERPDDPEILRDDREPERVAIFEQFVNGGLEIIQAHLNTHRLIGEDDALNALVNRHIDARQSESDINLARFADELGL